MLKILGLTPVVITLMRVSTELEFNEQIQTWSSSNQTGTFGSMLKLTASGGRSSSNGLLTSAGVTNTIYYWTSSFTGVYGRRLNMTTSSASVISLICAY